MNFGTFCHVEIPGTDIPKMKQFFGSLFGWTFDSSMPGYETYRTGENCIGGGLWTPPEGAPKAIVNYIFVPSVNEYIPKIQKAGGTILMEKQEVPGMGWFAIFGDPEGNRWGIWEVNPEHMQRMQAEMAKKAAATQPAQRKAAEKKKAKPAKKVAPKAAPKAKAKAKAKPAKKAAKPAPKAKAKSKPAPKAKAKAKPAAKKKKR